MDICQYIELQILVGAFGLGAIVGGFAMWGDYA